MIDDELRTPSGRLNALYPEYERQKCFVGYSPDTSWHEDLVDACNDVLQEFDMEPWYATEYFAPTQSLREKVVEMIANTHHGLYDLSCWRKNDKGEWQVPRDVFIELGIAIALNRPLLMLRHSSNSVAELPLPQCLAGLGEQIIEFSGRATLKRKLRERLSQWQQTEPEKDWWNRYCIFGARKCEYRETSPYLRQWGQETLHCHVSDGRDVDREDFRDVVEEVLKRFDDLTFNYLDSLSLADGYTFLLCSHCQAARSSPFAIYRISDQTPVETFIAIGMSLALETQFERKIPKILLTSHTEDIPSLLTGYDVMVAQNDGERKSSLSKFTPKVIHQVRKTTWKARPLPFIEVIPRSDGQPTSEESSEQGPENEYLAMIGKYGLMKQIDHSEIAVTYLVRDTENAHIYALKRLHANFASDQRSVTHFQREAAILSQLNDPHIIRGIEQGEDGMVPYFVMEHVEGQPLRQLMRMTGAMEVSRAINYTHQIASGLDAAYRLGIIHYDLTPGNILIDSQDQVKISNFGSAREVDERTITQESEVSSPYSMAPERLESSRNAGIRSALYALAVLFFDMLAGRPPFTGETALDVAMQHVNKQVPSLCLLRPDLPGVLDFFMQKAMAKHPDDRYQTPGEFIAALDQLQQAASLTPPGNHTLAPVNEGEPSVRGVPALIGKTFGNYRLFDYLGTRGLSDVFKAYGSTPDRIVAMKVFSSTLLELPGFREAFEQEMPTFAPLSHPNLISIYDFGVQNDQPYIVQEYVDGGSFTRQLKTGLAAQKIVEYIIQAAEGLAYLHHNGLIHQDVSPENMLLRSDDRLLLSNWEILNVFKTAQFSLDAPSLSAPEQAKDQPADHRSNIYSLGMTLFGCLLFGKVASSTFFDRSIVGEDAAYFPIWYLRFAHISVELQRVILKMMQEQPDDRYQSMQEVIDALRAAAALIVIEQEQEHTDISTKGMDRCAFCNATTTPEDEVCANCGNRLLPEKLLQPTVPLSAPAWGQQTAPAYYPNRSYRYDPHATIVLYLCPVCGEGLQFSDTCCPNCGYILTLYPSREPQQPSPWRTVSQVLYCASCGAAALPGYTYCTKCNSSLLPPPALTNCRYCSAVVRSDDKYCMNCGQSLLSAPGEPDDPTDFPSGPVSAEADFPSGNWSTRGPAPAPRAASPDGWGGPPATDGWGSPSPQPSQGNNICPYCGEATRPGDNFCLNCGNRLPAVPPQPSWGQTSDPWSAPPPPDPWSKQAIANSWGPAPSFSGWGSPPPANSWGSQQPPANPWGEPEFPTQPASNEEPDLFLEDYHRAQDIRKAASEEISRQRVQEASDKTSHTSEEEVPAPSLTGQFGTAWTGSPAPISQEDLNNIGKIFGNYRILRDIGQGGLGRVYLALHTVSYQPAAVKLFYSHLSSKQRQNLFFLQEPSFDHLRHPYILPIIEVNMSENPPYLITEYAPLGSLHDRIQSGQPLLIESAVTILSQIGKALAHIHQHNIVHRDLKPGNILFNDNNEALLSDFDIAVILDTGDSKAVNTWSSPPYMAPEQFGGTVSRQSDQYSLGCIAYRLFTGKRPFDDSDLMALQYKHTTQQPIAPHQLNPGIPEHIERAILRTMAKNPTDRFADVMAFVAALRAENISAN